MKKILVSLLVLALCAPAMAATITVVDNLDGTTATIQIATESGEPNIVGVALDVDLNEGSVQSLTIDTANFNVYPDAGFSLGTSFDPWGSAAEQGGPVANQGSAGQQSLPMSSFALSFANLNGATTPGAAGAALIEVTLTMQDPNEVTVCENATRGGLVAVDGTALVAACDTVAIAPPAGPGCQDFDVVDDDVVNVTDLNDLVSFVELYKGGRWSVPDTHANWDPKYDFNGDGVVNVTDLNELVSFVELNKGGRWSVGCL